MKPLKLESQVINGKLPDATRITIADAIKGLDGKRVIISVEEKKSRRSLNQNAFYHGVVIPTVRLAFLDAGTPLTAYECHEILFGAVVKHTKAITMPDGSIKEVRRSSTDMTTAEWENAMEMIRAWAAQWGIIIPLPNE